MSFVILFFLRIFLFTCHSVIAEDLVNVALSKSTSYSSQMALFYSKSAVNGRYETSAFYFMSMEEENPWWTVDLAGTYSIQYIYMVLPTKSAYSPNGLSSFTVSTGNLCPDHLDPVYKICYIQSNPAPLGSRSNITCNSSMYAQFVKIQLGHEGYLVLSEVEVYTHTTMVDANVPCSEDKSSSLSATSVLVSSVTDVTTEVTSQSRQHTDLYSYITSEQSSTYLVETKLATSELNSKDTFIISTQEQISSDSAVNIPTQNRISSDSAFSIASQNRISSDATEVTLSQTQINPDTTVVISSKGQISSDTTVVISSQGQTSSVTTVMISSQDLISSDTVTGFASLAEMTKYSSTMNGAMNETNSPTEPLESTDNVPEPFLATVEDVIQTKLLIESSFVENINSDSPYEYPHDDSTAQFETTLLKSVANNVINDVSNDARVEQDLLTNHLVTITEYSSQVDRGNAGCSCRCRRPMNDAAMTEMQQNVKKLTLNPTSLSQQKRKKISVKDDRISAQSIGYVGVCTLVLVFGPHVMTDVISVLRFLLVKLRDSVHQHKSSRNSSR